MDVQSKYDRINDIYGRNCTRGLMGRYYSSPNIEINKERVNYSIKDLAYVPMASLRMYRDLHKILTKEEVGYLEIGFSDTGKIIANCKFIGKKIEIDEGFLVHLHDIKNSVDRVMTHDEIQIVLYSYIVCSNRTKEFNGMGDRYIKYLKKK